MKFQNKYYILRHGQTIYQTKKKDTVYPRDDRPKVPLTKKGEKQIKAAAKKLKKARIDLIYSSDFYRARQTAQIVARELGLKKLNPVRKRGFLNGVNFDKRLRDVNLGIYHGGKKEDFYRSFPLGSEFFHKRPKGGENWGDILKRALNFLKEIDKKYKGKNILIISHGDPLWLLERKVKGLPSMNFLKAQKNNYIQPGELRKL